MIDPEKFQKLIHKITLNGGAVKNGYRKWWNPMRWVKGIVYIKYISPKKLYK